MKTLKIISLIMFSMIFLSSNSFAKNNAKETLVEVVVFHGVKQCETCKAIKKNTKEVVETEFKNPGKDKKVIYKVIDFSKPENKKIAEKYEIAWTSVLLIKHLENGEEVVNNISRFAIKNARTNTPVYRKKLADDIKALLN